MLAAVTILIGGLWVVSLYLKKRYKLAGSSDGSKKIRVLENCHIGLKKTICLVQVSGELIVLAISGDAVTFLTKISSSSNNES